MDDVYCEKKKKEKQISKSSLRTTENQSSQV